MFMEVIPTYKVDWGASPNRHGFSFRVSGQDDLQALVRILVWNGVGNFTVEKEDGLVGGFGNAATVLAQADSV